MDQPSRRPACGRSKPPTATQGKLLHITITRNGRSRAYVLRPWLFGSVLALFVVFMAGYFLAAAYLIYRDDILGSALARQVELQHAYEDRIALLRSEIERLTSRHLVQTRTLEEQVEDLLERQDVLTRRQALLDQLIDRARAEGIGIARSAAPLPVPRPRLARSAARPAGDGAPLAFGPAEPSPALAITGSAIRPQPEDGAAGADKPDRRALDDLRSSLERAEDRQEAALALLSEATRQEIERLAAILEELGIRPPSPAKAADRPSLEMGGPFVPIEAELFSNEALSLSETFRHLDRVRASLDLLPLGTPVPDTEVTSGFGRRVDPFLGRPALHSGVDLRAEHGTAVRATAPGTVVAAGWNGGYGKMVEIEHGHRLTTRYAHLSAINVREGEKVEAGRVIGRVGTTGRSTGPHLHYETHRSGRPIDPTPYMEAGEAL